MSLLRVLFDSEKGVIIPVSVVTGKSAVEIEENVPMGFAIGDRAQDRQKENPKMEKAFCLIDTGSSISRISQRLAQKLNLKLSGMVAVNSVAGVSVVKSYFVTLIVPIGKVLHAFEGSQLAEYQTLSTDHDVLLGRDILARGIFQTDWNGQAILGF